MREERIEKREKRRAIGERGAKQSKAEQSKAKQSKADQSKAKQSKAKQSKATTPSETRRPKGASLDAVSQATHPKTKANFNTQPHTPKR